MPANDFCESRERYVYLHIEVSLSLKTPLLGVFAMGTSYGELQVYVY